jgi:hypothetical protein
VGDVDREVTVVGTVVSTPSMSKGRRNMMR